jgi:hypothetical protein
MKKKVLGILVGVFVILIVAVTWGFKSRDKKASTNQASQSTSNQTTDKVSSAKACDIFTVDDAKKVLGGDPKQSQPEQQAASSSTVSVSACSYTSTIATNQAQTALSATITVYAPQDSIGVQTNKSTAESTAQSASKVDGYDGVYWIAPKSQLLVYKNDKIVIITTAKGSLPIKQTTTKSPSLKATPGTLDDAKKIADIILVKI